MPRPRFSLRTLLVGVTLFCGFLGWLGWNWRIVQERRYVFGDLTVADMPKTSPYCTMADPRPMPFPRSWLGDQRMKFIAVNRNCDPKAIERVRTVYPEAEIIVSTDPVGFLLSKETKAAVSRGWPYTNTPPAMP